MGNLFPGAGGGGEFLETSAGQRQRGNPTVWRARPFWSWKGWPSRPRLWPTPVQGASWSLFPGTSPYTARCPCRRAPPLTLPTHSSGSHAQPSGFSEYFPEPQLWAGPRLGLHTCDLTTLTTPLPQKDRGQGRGPPGGNSLPQATMENHREPTRGAGYVNSTVIPRHAASSCSLG